MAPTGASRASPAPTHRPRVHGEFLRVWESNAPLTESQIALYHRLEASVSAPLLKRNSNAAFTASNTTDDVFEDLKAAERIKKGAVAQPESYGGADGLKGLATVTTPEEFLEWHNEMERRLEEANDDKFRRIIGALLEDRAKAVSMLETIQDAEKALEDIRAGRTQVASVTETFRQDCETMVAERTRLGELADALRKRLAYFEELETLTVYFGGGKKSIHPTHPDFVRLLHRLDECVAYASSSTGAVADADGYLARFLELQKRAFTMVRDHMVALLRDTSSQILKELRDERVAGTVLYTDLSDAAKEYLRFRTIAGSVKSFMAELFSRSRAPSATASASNRRRSSFRAGAHSDTFGNSNNSFNPNKNPLLSTRSTALQLFSDCEECYMDQRKRLIDPSVHAHVKSLAEDRDMISLARLGSSFVLRVCTLERQLYEHFFPSGSEERESQVLNKFLKSICDYVYDELRPLILQENDLDKLVYLIEVLKTEILNDEVPRRGAAGIAFAPSAQRAVADAQERIIYRAEVYLRDEIRGFTPTPIQLDYPGRLIRHQKLMESRSAPSTPKMKPVPSSTSNNNNDNNSGGNENDEDVIEPLIQQEERRTDAEIQAEEEEFRSGSIYSAWYPPVERTLRLLSMLYRCVDSAVFAGVAQESVAACVQLVSNAAERIAKSGKEDAEDHAQLFLVWQLLMTREQISPFDVEMSYTEHELDFSDLRALLGNVIRGRLSLRSLATPPAVRQKVIDSKRELDHRVKTACESFILKTTRLLLDPILAFLAKCNALPMSAREDSVNRTPLKEGEVPPTPPPLTPFETLKKNKGSFADPERLKETWNSVLEAVEKELPRIFNRMKIYITKPASRYVLFRPIRANVAEAATELLSAVQTRYSLEERAQIGVDGDAVTMLVDRVEVLLEIGPRMPMSPARR